MELNNELSVQLQQLLVASFPEIYPEDRMYFKQVPHSRLLVMDAEHRLIGHVGLDYRTMNLNGTAIRVLGVIDLCISVTHRSKGIASMLLGEVDKLSKQNVDFILLFADHVNLYVRNGYQSVKNRCKWLKIDHTTLTTVGIGDQVMDGLMMKQAGTVPWDEGELDFIGYLY
ncbi:GNAT family N-acetyltransferase [Paenibacillus xylanilyticus]|uniref:GNAT family N-acetyltransferase n=2 Tax=Paenibacillus xylanilyticus TaxID=248903 RepID=A0A7Y6BXJ2_9BACL|nr:GNAT family N-acetyltransferase [Paenibacillus xylanilyticus]